MLLARIKQEAPLTQRGQSGRCRIIFGSFPSPWPRPLFPLVVVLMVGLGEPQQHAKFEVAKFSRYTNIGIPKILGELL